MVDPSICARFIEFLISERDEETSAFHDRLAELYLKMTGDAKKHGDSGNSDVPFLLSAIEQTFTEKHKEAYGKLLHFIDTTNHYQPDRLYGLLPSDGMSPFLPCICLDLTPT